MTLSTIDGWLNGALKTEQYIKDNGIEYIIGGHTPYLNTPEYASWVATAMQYAKEQITADSAWQGGLVIVENGQIVTGERLDEIFANGLTDREELFIASANFRNNLPTEPEENPGQTPDDDNKNPGNTDDQDNSNVNANTPQNKKSSSVKTGDETNLAWALLGLAGASVLYTVTKKTRKLN